MSDETQWTRYTCGTCRYYVERPSELLGICYRAGVCIKCAKPVDPDFGTT